LSSTTAGVTAPKKVSRLTRSSKILKVIINAIQDRKGEKIVSLDLRKIPEAVSDFFIVCEASSTVQVKAIADWVEVEVKKHLGEIPYRHEGHAAAQWILVDYVNVVVHVFLSETRKFYRLEEMWGDGDAEMEEYTEETPIKKKATTRKKK
jgi:ribosome-associated protein